MTIDEVIERAKKLTADRELEFLESFLLGMTIGARYLWIKNPEPKDRLTIFVQINEINHHLLNRVAALRGGDSFFTVKYTWHAVEEHFAGAPSLGNLATDFADACLKKHGV